jgi:hypothetical protein
MKKLMITMTVLLLTSLILLPLEGRAQTGPQGYGDYNYCPYCGSYLGPGGGYGMMGPGMMYRGYGMGPGMMGPGYGTGPGYGMSPGMMHRGWGMGPGMMGPGYGPRYGQPYGPRYQQPQEPLTEKDAKGMVENYLRSTRNPNLKLGKIEDKGPYFEAEILTKEGSLADKIAVDKNTGWMRSIY